VSWGSEFGYFRDGDVMEKGKEKEQTAFDIDFFFFLWDMLDYEIIQIESTKLYSLSRGLIFVIVHGARKNSNIRHTIMVKLVGQPQRKA
jgi:hypothetical protein